MAKSEFTPIALVLLIIDNDIKESWSNRTGHHYFQINQDKVSEAYLPLNKLGSAQRVRQLVGDSALYRYIQVNLGFNLEKFFPRSVLLSNKSDKTQAAAPDIEQLSHAATEYFLATLPEAAGIPTQKIILVFDSDREKIYDPSKPPHRGVDSTEAQNFFKEKALAYGYQIVDTKPIFSAHYRTHHQKFDYLPTDRHWNGLAHRVVAGEVFKILSPGSK